MARAPSQSSASRGKVRQKAISSKAPRGSTDPPYQENSIVDEVGFVVEEEMTNEIKDEKMKGMKKAKIIFGLIIIILAVAAGFVVANMWPGKATVTPSAYSMVYLSTGDMYFGRLSSFPSLHMTDVWYLQRGQDQTGATQLSISPLKSVFWGPTDEINLNDKDIVFSVRLRSDSQVVQAIQAQINGQAPLGTQGNVPSGTVSNPAPSTTNTDLGTSSAKTK